MSSCPDWTSLAAHRRDRAAAEPEGWSEAVTHFDDCKICRRQALAADPTLVFRRLSVVPASVMSPAEEHSEVEAVRAAVAGMRAASRLDSLEARSRTHSGHSGPFGWKRWPVAAAAAILALAAVASPVYHRSNDRPMGTIGAMGLPGLPTATAASWSDLSEAEPANMQIDLDGPVVEGVNLPDARIYHMSGEGMSVVMVVDESIDI